MKIELIIAIIITIIVLLILFIISTIISTRKKAKKVVYNIERAVESINSYLEQNINILESTKQFIKDAEFNDNYNNSIFKTMNSKEKYQKILKYNNLIRDIIIDDDELMRDKDLGEILDNLDEVKSYLEGSIKYYNYCLEEYSNIFTTLKGRMVKCVCKRKKFEDYKEESMEVL